MQTHFMVFSLILANNEIGDGDFFFCLLNLLGFFYVFFTIVCSDVLLVFLFCSFLHRAQYSYDVAAGNTAFNE